MSAPDMHAAEPPHAAEEASPDMLREVVAEAAALSDLDYEARRKALAHGWKREGSRFAKPPLQGDLFEAQATQRQATTQEAMETTRVEMVAPLTGAPWTSLLATTPHFAHPQAIGDGRYP
jgi:hypothetical protein